MPTRINVTHYTSQVRLEIDDGEPRKPVDLPITQALLLAAGITAECVGRLHVALNAPTIPPPPPASSNGEHAQAEADLHISDCQYRPEPTPQDGVTDRVGKSPTSPKKSSKQKGKR